MNVLTVLASRSLFTTFQSTWTAPHPDLENRYHPILDFTQNQKTKDKYSYALTLTMKVQIK